MSTSHILELAGKIVIVSLVILAMGVILVSFIHLYAKWFWYNLTAPDSRRRRGDFTAGHQEQESSATVLRRGLNPSVLKSIPVTPFDPKNFAEGLDCAVCLSELSEGEKTRILPKCDHGFHVECIDMWFSSHQTCPICRNPVSMENLKSTTDEMEAIDHDQEPVVTCDLASSSSSSSSSSSQAIAGRLDLVIDIPRQFDGEEDKKSPVSSRMRSIKRILSDSRRYMNPFSRAAIDAELPGS